MCKFICKILTFNETFTRHSQGVCLCAGTCAGNGKTPITDIYKRFETTQEINRGSVEKETKCAKNQKKWQKACVIQKKVVTLRDF